MRRRLQLMASKPVRPALRANPQNADAIRGDLANVTIKAKSLLPMRTG